MASKALLVLCVLLAVALLASSEVAEKHDAKKVNEDGLDPPSYGGGGHPDGRGGYNRRGPGGGDHGNPGRGR